MVQIAGRRQCSQQRRGGGKGKKLTSAYDIYQLVVGEIGIPRREFLYDLQFWEVRRIIRGYRRRDRLKLQIMAECAYAALFAMRDPNGKTAADLFPQLFNDDEEEPEPISEEEQNDLLDVIRAVNHQKT